MFNRYENISYAESPFGTLNQFVAKTFGWMFAGLLVTFAAAVGTVSTGAFVMLFNTGLVFALTIAELVLVMVLSARITKLQPSTATAMFFVYAVLNGINLSVYFIAYDLSTLILAFLVGAVYFGVMAVYGANTQRDLLGWAPKLMGGLVALLVTALVGGLFGLLLGISFGFLDVVYCGLSVLLFMGMTAYDTQMLKHHYAYFGGDAAMLQKASIFGALNLYLDFINIFLYIVRILGRNRDN